MVQDELMKTKNDIAQCEVRDYDFGAVSKEETVKLAQCEAV